MKVILLQNVARVGSKGDIVEVSEGYARNFLIKNGYAKEASASNIKEFEQKKQAQKKKKQEILSKELSFVSKHKNKPFEIEVNANEKGHIFEKIDARKLVGIIKEKESVDFSEKNIILPEPIKSVGDFELEAQIDGKKRAFKLKIKKAN